MRSPARARAAGDGQTGLSWRLGASRRVSETTSTANRGVAPCPPPARPCAQGAGASPPSKPCAAPSAACAPSKSEATPRHEAHRPGPSGHNRRAGRRRDLRRRGARCGVPTPAARGRGLRYDAGRGDRRRVGGRSRRARTPGEAGGAGARADRRRRTRGRQPGARARRRGRRRSDARARSGPGGPRWSTRDTGQSRPKTPPSTPRNRRSVPMPPRAARGSPATPQRRTAGRPGTEPDSPGPGQQPA